MRALNAAVKLLLALISTLLLTSCGARGSRGWNEEELAAALRAELPGWQVERIVLSGRSDDPGGPAVVAVLGAPGDATGGSSAAGAAQVVVAYYRSPHRYFFAQVIAPRPLAGEPDRLLIAHRAGSADAGGVYTPFRETYPPESHKWLRQTLERAVTATNRAVADGG